MTATHPAIRKENLLRRPRPRWQQRRDVQRYNARAEQHVVHHPPTEVIVLYGQREQRVRGCWPDGAHDGDGHLTEAAVEA